MTRMTPTPSARLLVALALLTSPLPALAWDDCKHVAERSGSVDTTGAERVEIVARAGDLTVRPAPAATLSASGRACASRQSFLDETQLHVRRRGAVIEVVVQIPDDMSGIGIFYAYLDLTVQVPAGLPVAVTDSSGDVLIDGVRAVRIKDSSGDVVARRLPGDVEIEDSSGDLRVEDVKGAVRVSDSSGDIVVRRAQDVHVVRDSSGAIDIGSVTGNVTIDQDSSGDVVVAGVGGNFALLADGSGDVRVTGVEGEVRVP
jgi:DUF4097 and DUF4098 domain-containing protein YvlB